MNMIIVVILALVFLGIASALIYKWFDNVDITFPKTCDIYPPTADNPVCVLNSYDIPRGKTAQLETAFYNNENADIPAATLPQVTCGADVNGETLDFTTSTQGQDISVGEAKDYILLVKVPKDAPRSTFPCTLRLSETSESFTIIVR